MCPSMYFTWRMSFVFWYSVVALRCLSVWKWIFLIRGLLSSLATLRLDLSNEEDRVFTFGLKIRLSFLFFMALSIAINWLDIGRVLLLLPFSAWFIASVLFLKSMSVHSICDASPILGAVS